MNNFVINEEDNLLKLNNLKIDKSPGIDDINPRVLKEVKLETKNFLTKLLILSLICGYLPLDWKLSAVTAIHKEGSKSEVFNYQPVLLISLVIKILESLIGDKIMYYLAINNYLSTYQFGLTKGKSTVLQL